MEIRRAKRADYLDIAELDRRAWKGRENEEGFPDGDLTWRVWIETGLVFCAEQDGSIVGVIVAFSAGERLYCLHKEFVDFEWRGSGLSARLFHALLMKVDRLKIDLFVLLDAAHMPVIEMYERWGFERVGENEEREAAGRRLVRLERRVPREPREETVGLPGAARAVFRYTGVATPLPIESN